MKVRYNFAISRRGAPEFCLNVPPSEIRGRRESRVPVAPAAACAVVESTRVSHHGFAGITRPSLRNGFNSLFRALPGDRACLPPSPRGVASAKLDASVGASGPHDFAVRKATLSSGAPPASTASRLDVRDDRETPLCAGRDGERYAGDLGQKGMEIFLQRGLDRQITFRTTPADRDPDREAM
jgi:hypothetical protein